MAAVVLVAVGAFGLAEAQPPAQPLPHLPPQVKNAWTAAGAEAVWMGEGEFGHVQLVDPGLGVAVQMPAFSFEDQAGISLVNVPAPAVPFGLEFYHTEATLASFKELARMKHLQALLLVGPCGVTDNSLKELAHVQQAYGETMKGGRRRYGVLKNVVNLRGV